MKKYILSNSLDQAIAANAMMRFLIGKYNKIEWVGGPPWIDICPEKNSPDWKRAKRVWYQVNELAKEPRYNFPDTIYKDMLELQVYVKELI